MTKISDDIITKIALERIADALEEILTFVKKDMEDSKSRITAQWDNELDKKEVVKSDNNFNYSQLELPFPEVE